MGLTNNNFPIVVTGGAGFLGQNVIKYLCEIGKECIIIDQKSPSMPEIRDAVRDNRVRLLIADQLKKSSIAEISIYLPDKFHLVHLAAVIETTTEVGLQTKKTIEYHCVSSMITFECWGKKLISACYTSSW
jgi:nucleoside-diphosphate-sugar epimerase